MRLIASAITAVALLTHAMLGCCSHHAHAATFSSEGPAATECCHEHGCDAVQVESLPTESEGGDHQEHGPCGEADCSFAGGGDRLSIDSPLAGLALPLVELAPRSVDGTGQATDLIGVERRQGPAIFIRHQRLIV